jgi:hypothetical protein
MNSSSSSMVLWSVWRHPALNKTADAPRLHTHLTGLSSGVVLAQHPASPRAA